MPTSSAHRWAGRATPPPIPTGTGGGVSATRRGSGLGPTEAAEAELARGIAGGDDLARRGNGSAATWCRRGYAGRLAVGAATAMALGRFRSFSPVTPL